VPRIEIAKIGVRAQVIDIGTNDAGKLIPPNSFDVAGWWAGGTPVGDRGPAVVVGHVDDRVRPGVFSRLRELDPGDRIRFVGKDGEVHRFEVVHSERHQKARFPTLKVYGPTRERALRLITCGGPFNSSVGHYRDNLIVFARHV
jgi:hypothetical protein